MTTWDRVLEWLLAYAIPFILRIAGILLLAWALEWQPGGVWAILGALILWDLASGWRNAAGKHRLFSDANCAICGQRMKYEENYLTNGDNRVDWHIRHTGSDVIDRVMRLAGMESR